MLTLLADTEIDKLMTEYGSALKEGITDNLKAVVLYGSCARGEHEVGSDIDVFVLVNTIEKKLTILYTVYRINLISITTR